MKVVIDTNIFVSFLIGRIPQRLVEKLKTREIELIISDDLFEELIEVVNRPKFHGIFSKEDIKDLFILLEERATRVSPLRKINDCRDSKDNMVLECAEEGKADCIISNDKDLLTLHPYKGTSIITLTKFKKLLTKRS